jgi:hypothetical protein
METDLSKCLHRRLEGWRWRRITQCCRCVLVDADRCLLRSSLDLLFPMRPQAELVILLVQGLLLNTNTRTCSAQLSSLHL